MIPPKTYFNKRKKLDSALQINSQAAQANLAPFGVDRLAGRGECEKSGARFPKGYENDAKYDGYNKKRTFSLAISNTGDALVQKGRELQLS